MRIGLVLATDGEGVELDSEALPEPGSARAGEAVSFARAAMAQANAKLVARDPDMTGPPRN